jgi:hypothetical protein
VLVISPDFPPAHGGVQLVAHRVPEHATAYEPRVVTFDAPGAAVFDADQPFEVRRIAKRPRGRRLAVLRLNAAAVGEALAFRPDAVLSVHIVAAPAA